MNGWYSFFVNNIQNIYKNFNSTKITGGNQDEYICPYEKNL